MAEAGGAFRRFRLGSAPLTPDRMHGESVERLDEQRQEPDDFAAGPL